MPQPVGRKGKPAPRRRFLRRARRGLAVLLLLGLTALVWGFMLQRLAARIAAVRNPPPGCRHRLDLQAMGNELGPSLRLNLTDLNCPSPLGGWRPTI